MFSFSTLLNVMFFIRVCNRMSTTESRTLFNQVIQTFDLFGGGFLALGTLIHLASRGTAATVGVQMV